MPTKTEDDRVGASSSPPAPSTPRTLALPAATARVVSGSGARVTERVYDLSARASRQLEIMAKVPRRKAATG